MNKTRVNRVTDVHSIRGCYLCQHPDMTKPYYISHFSFVCPLCGTYTFMHYHSHSTVTTLFIMRKKEEHACN